MRRAEGKDGEMKRVLWFLVGVVAGFTAAHFLNKAPRGHEVLAAIDARMTEFTGLIGDAYREQEARLTASDEED